MTFLGQVITAEGKSLSPKHVEAIQNIPKHETKKQVMSFSLAHGKGLAARDKVTWTDDAEKAFSDMKTALKTTLTLGLPYSSRPFIQTVDEKNG